MNILLIQSYIGNNELPVFPLGLSHIAASIDDHRVKIFDPNIVSDPFGAFEKELVEYKPELLGISIRNIDSTNKKKVVYYYPYTKNLLDIVERVWGSKIKIIAGGAGFSMFAEEIMNDEPRFDYGVFGEGERTFPLLLKNLEHPEKVKGVYFRKNGGVYFSGRPDHPELDKIPFVRRYEMDAACYRNWPEAFGVETKRGCAFRCIYCPYIFLNGCRYRLRTPEKVVDEIEFFQSEFGVSRFTFIDSVFNFPVEHAETICREIIRRNISVSWSAWFHDKFITEDLVSLAQNAGCKNFILSPDGFSDQILIRLQKYQSHKDILTAFHILKRRKNIDISYNFFKNPPGQNLASFLRFIWFLGSAKFQLRDRIHFELNSIRIEPHTRLQEIAIEEGMLKEGDSLLFPKGYSNSKTRYIERLFDFMLEIRERKKSETVHNFLPIG
jgi:5-methoxybenzimidazole methyltransferase